MPAKKKTKLEDRTYNAHDDWIQIRPIAKESKTTKSGLVRPDSEEREQKASGEIVSVGRYVENLEVGQQVVYGVFAGEILEVIEKGKKVEFVFIKAEDIICIVS